MRKTKRNNLASIVLGTALMGSSAFAGMGGSCGAGKCGANMKKEGKKASGSCGGSMNKDASKKSSGSCGSMKK